MESADITGAAGSSPASSSDTPAGTGRMNATLWRVLGAVAVVGVVVGIVLYISDATASIGVLCLLLAGALIPPAIVAASIRTRPAGGVVLAVLSVTLTLALFILALLGFTQRGTYQFAERYGQKVEVKLPEKCSEFSSIKRGSYTTCSKATWELDGSTVEGTLYAGYGELRDKDRLAPSLRRDSIEAYAVGDNAYTDGYAPSLDGPSRIYHLGLVPAWLFIPFPVALVLVLARYRHAIRQWAHSDS